MVAIPRLQTKRRFVTPAQAGIHLRARCKAKENLNSGPGSRPGQALRRNDDKEESTSGRRIQNPSAFKPRVIEFSDLCGLGDLAGGHPNLVCAFCVAQFLRIRSGQALRPIQRII